MTVTKNWFEVDREGLAKALERRGKEYVIFELVSNCLDTAAKQIEVTLTKEPDRPRATLVICDDDPDGFRDLAHAYTLFAESNRKGDASKRGRFNFGEKIVLAACYDALIATTTGSVRFDQEGRHRSSIKRERGSVFTATIRMNKDEFEKARQAVTRILTPPGVTLTFNGESIPTRERLAAIPHVPLPTVAPDEEGFLKRTWRSTEIHVYEPAPGETGTLYELGIPVVESGDKWHVDIRQKVPLNLDRDNVDPGYLRDVRVAVANALAERLTVTDAATPLASDALADRDAAPETVNRILDLRYGEKRAIYDPSDREANNRLVASGYTLIHGGQLTGEQWENVRRHAAAKPAGQIMPTPRPRFSPDGVDYWIPEEKWTYGMRRIAKYVRLVAPHLIDREVSVGILDAPPLKWAACFGDNELVFNVARLGKEWFNNSQTDVEVNELLIHELAHSYEENHLDEKYHEACCKIGARLAKVYLDNTMMVLS